MHKLLLWLFGFLMVLPAGGAEPLQAAPEAKPPAVTLDGQKRLCIGGQPFFTVGIYSVWPAEKLEEARGLGFNTVHTYKGEGLPDKDNAGTPEEIRAYLDAAHKLGLKVFLGLPRYQVLKSELKRLEERIVQLRDHPALLAWYLFDEPCHSKFPAAPVQASADLVRKLDPWHPTILVECVLHEKFEYHSKHPDYVSIPDILMTDPYPCTPKNADLSPVAREIEVARKLTKGEKPIWNVIQLHGAGKGGAGYGLKEPNWTELRNMVYQSLGCGVKGLTFFAYFGSEFKLYQSQDGMQNVRRIAAELKVLTPYLLADAVAVPPLTVAKNASLLTRTFAHDGKRCFWP